MKMKLATVLLLGFALPAFAGEAVTLYSNPTCNCCQTYADYLTANGYDVTVVLRADYDKVATMAGMPQDGIGCHVAVIDGYTLSGFIPAKFIEKLTTEKPDVSGITLPGMRMDAPDMADEALKMLKVYAYAPTGVTLYPVE
jgi:hypothetical protein